MIDVINRVPKLQVAGAHVKKKMRDMQIVYRQYAYEHGLENRKSRTGTGPTDRKH